MAKKARNFRFSDLTSSQLAAICDHRQCEATAGVEHAIALAAAVIATGDEWVGTGPWRGWRITTAHELATEGAVLVAPDGYVMTPEDLLE